MLSEVLASANRLLETIPETDLYEDVKFTGDLVAKLKVPVLEPGNTEKRRQALLEAQDASKVGGDTDDDAYAYKHEAEKEDGDEWNQLSQLNAAVKTIQITGQIVRSFAGSLKGDQKRELAESCFNLGLRLLRFGFDAFNMGRDVLGMSLRKRVKLRDESISDEQATQIANAMVFTLVEMCTFGIVRHIAMSIGVERLAMTFKEIKEKKNTIAVRTIDAAIQLEHFQNIPEKQVADLYKEVKDVLLLRSLVQHFVWDRLYYFHAPQAVQQRVCSSVGIEWTATLAASTLDSDRKRD